MGEGLDNEAELMPYIQAANIACGGHAGDIATINRVIDLAIQHQVEIGLHPSYPDRENFGRKAMNIATKDLSTAWQRQFEDFLNCSQRKNIQVNHIKPHGALYHALSKSPELADLFLQMANAYLPGIKLFAAPNSNFIRQAEQAGFQVIPEGFADRKYLADGHLMSRAKPEAIIHDAETMAEQINNMWTKETIVSNTGESISLKVKTICVHSDHPNAIANLKYFYQQYTA